MLRGQIKILETNKQIEKMIMQSLAVDLNKYYGQRASKVLIPIQQALRVELMRSPTLNSLSGAGKLRADFGIPSGADVVSPIVEAIVNSCKVSMQKITHSSGGFKGGLVINVQPSSFANLLGLSSGSVKTLKGHNIPWLSWLLEAGSSVIIANFGVKYKMGTGRSGQATMTSGKRPFSVDPTYSGTPTSNFVTKAVENIQDDLISIIKGVL
jgi:hypothetical protein